LIHLDSISPHCIIQRNDSDGPVRVAGEKGNRAILDENLFQGKDKKKEGRKEKN
jgi:hypothetical protein